MADPPNSEHSQQGHEGYVVDAENAAEMARLVVLQQVLTKAMGGVLAEQSDLSQVRDVLDIACGPGAWVLDVAQQYPDMHLVGIDISQLMIEYANDLAKSQGVAQVRFQVMDATKPLLFPDASFDLVNGRILTGFLTREQWSQLLAECSRITRTGGILRLTEGEWGFTNSVAFDKLMEISNRAMALTSHSFSPRGRTIGTANVLRLLMQQAGYEVLGYRAHAVDYSAGTELHDGNIQNFLVFQKLLQPLLVQMQLTTQEELDRLYEQFEQEVFAPTFCGVDYYLTVWGRKN
jgi:ubiquinone/menaquinone biosynthesis C-methylase UbiE